MYSGATVTSISGFSVSNVLPQASVPLQAPLFNQVERLPVGVETTPGQCAELAVFPPPTQGVTPAGNGAVRG